MSGPQVLPHKQGTRDIYTASRRCVAIATTKERIKALRHITHKVKASQITGLYTKFVLIGLDGESIQKVSPYNEGNHPTIVTVRSRIFLWAGWDSTFRIARYHEIEPVPMEDIEEAVLLD